MSEKVKITLQWTRDYTRPEDIVIKPMEGIVRIPRDVEIPSREDRPVPAYAYCLILRKRWVKGVPGYRVLHAVLMKDANSEAAAREMFEKIATEQHGRGRVVARVGTTFEEEGGNLQIEEFDAVRQHLVSRLKLPYAPEPGSTGDSCVPGLSQGPFPDTTDAANITIENIGFYAPLKKHLDTSEAVSPVFSLTKREIGRVHREVWDWLDHLTKVSRDSLETFCLGERALELAENRFGPDGPVTAKYLRLMAFCCKEHGRYEEVEELLRRQLAIQVKAHGRMNVESAGTLANLAGALKCQGRSEQALPLMREALMIGKKLEGPDSVDSGKYYFNLGSIYEDLDRSSLVLRYYRKARSILEEALGAEHPDLQRVYRRLASGYERRGDYVRAEEIYRKRIAICMDRLGLTQQETLNQLEKLAARFLDWGKPDEAAKLYQEWMDTVDDSDEHNRLIKVRIIEHLARALKQTGNYPVMEAYCTRALDLLQEDGRQGCAQRSALLALKAEALGEMGNFEEADSLFELAFKQVKSEYRKSRVIHQWIRCLVEWADAAVWKELDDAAECCYWRALMAIGEKDDRDDRFLKDQLQRCLFGLGRIMQSQGRYLDAKDFYRDALEALEDEYGVNDYRTVEPLKKLAWLFRRAGQPEKAYEYELRIEKAKRSIPDRAQWHHEDSCPSVRRIIPMRQGNETKHQLEQE